VTFTAAVVGETRVIVRLDNVEMAPLKLLFIDSGKASKGGGKAGETSVPFESAEANAAAQQQQQPNGSAQNGDDGGNGFNKALARLGAFEG